MTQTMIEVDGLVKKYGDLVAVNGVEFNVGAGEVFGLLGPNGAGKTTTIEMLVGLRKPDGGTARLSGFDIRKQINDVKEVIGVQLQSTSLFELLTVKEIMNMYASFYPYHVSVDELLAEVLLTEKSKDRVKSLSGGQKQRLAIALAIIHDPKIVFLDEPTTGLDPQARRTLWDIIERLKERGKTIMLSTHYMDEAHVLCDRIGIMDQGTLIALDTPHQLVKNLQSDSAIEVTLQAEEDATFLHTLQAVKQVSNRQQRYVVYTDSIQTTLTDLIQQASEREIPLDNLQTRTATLEDVFIHMTGRSLRE
ncbi:ABC transporter ATP-binding protein [Bacillus sp. HMF5848]|uniref:ABC transporter ATP-binding protein n=1 Tax=Bacillus sp. HMF5848 TaxID=2495421 RepID=UPI000F793733|nr:ABC transporter ATP-binding protein [Bacillus sp. HMF5848]RSK27197.1 ABC transporter ATP-binding protein [Bacillus sp. HMF5848]